MQKTPSLLPVTSAESAIVLSVSSVFQDSGEFDEMSEEFRNRLGLVPVIIESVNLLSLLYSHFPVLYRFDQLHLTTVQFTIMEEGAVSELLERRSYDSVWCTA